MPRLLPFTLLLVLISPQLSAQTSASVVDDYIHSEMSRYRVPGLALLVAKNHHTVLAANYGTANLEDNASVTDHTSFEIASMSKQFTDAAILLLAQRGKLSIFDSISKFFPDVPPSWQSISLLQLMNHTAGLRDDWDEPDSFFYSKTTFAEFLDALKATSLKFTPGTQFSYGCGPFILGLVIEKVTGKSYRQFMHDSIFEPLGMSFTDINDPTVIVPERAAGYVIRQGAIRIGIRISPAAEARADVGIRTTTHDLALWDAALDGSSFLSASSRELMFTPGHLNNGDRIPYGLGWFITPFRGHTEIQHGGSFRTGFSSVIARYPDDHLTIIVLTNVQGGHAYAIARGVAAFYNPEYRPIRTMQDRPDKNLSRTDTVHRILTALRDGKSAPDLVPGALRFSLWSAAEIREELAKASPATFVDCQDLSRNPADFLANKIVANCFYRTDGDKSRFWAFSFTDQGRVPYFELEE